MEAIVHLASRTQMADVAFAADQRVVARQGFLGDQYPEVKLVEVGDLTGEDAAEELFDLTNNPSRQEEREQKYGRGRSLSVGDIVWVQGKFFVCLSVGWSKL